MAESETPTATATAKQQVLVSKHVQELTKNIDKLPERFVHKESNYGGIDASCPVAEVPVIDYSLLTSFTPQGRQEVQKLGSALSLWGCFQAINHGIENSLLDKVREVAKQFYALPMEEKHKCSRAVDNVEGYGNDTVVSEHQTIDWTDRLYLTVDPEHERKVEYWPKNPENFSETLDEYTTRARMIKDNVVKAMARSLNLEENSFLRELGGNAGGIEARFNFYPPCNWPDKVLGVKAHADGSAITILLQDKQVEGLQVMKDDEWFRVPINIPYALFINAGEFVEIMSNGIFKSPMHRALINSKKERMTVALFCNPEIDKEVGPVEELIDHQRPRLYNKMPYNLANYFQYYQQGNRAIDAVKLKL